MNEELLIESNNLRNRDEIILIKTYAIMCMLQNAGQVLNA